MISNASPGFTSQKVLLLNDLRPAHGLQRPRGAPVLLSSSTRFVQATQSPHLGSAGPQLAGTLAMLSTDGTGAGKAPHTGHTTGLSSQPTRTAIIRVDLTLIRTLPTYLARTGRSGEQAALADVQGILTGCFTLPPGLSLLSHVDLQLSLLTWRLHSAYASGFLTHCRRKTVAVVHDPTLLAPLQAQVLQMLCIAVDSQHFVQAGRCRAAGAVVMSVHRFFRTCDHYLLAAQHCSGTRAGAG